MLCTSSLCSQVWLNFNVFILCSPREPLFSLQTVLMDQVRFLEMQQEAEWLVLLSSVLLIVYTTTGEAISGLPGLMETLKNTVSAMLTEMHLP